MRAILLFLRISLLTVFLFVIAVAVAATVEYKNRTVLNKKFYKKD